MGSISVLVIALAAGPAAAPPASIRELGWIAGCWEGSEDGRVFAEQWMKPAGGTLLGMSRTVVGDETVSYEHLRIHTDGHGIYYVARPAGQAETAFKLVKLVGQELVFENPEHDFPQRVLYRLTEDGRLAAAIEGTVDGQIRRIEFPMKRVACD